MRDHQSLGVTFTTEAPCGICISHLLHWGMNDTGGRRLQGTQVTMILLALQLASHANSLIPTILSSSFFYNIFIENSKLQQIC